MLPLVWSFLSPLLGPVSTLPHPPHWASVWGMHRAGFRMNILMYASAINALYSGETEESVRGESWGFSFLFDHTKCFLSPCAWAMIGRHAERISVLWCGSAWLGIPHPCSQRVEEQKESLLYAHMNAMSLFMEKRLCLEALWILNVVWGPLYHIF